MADNQNVTLRVQAKDDGATQTVNKVTASLGDVAKGAAAFTLVQKAIEGAMAAVGKVADFLGDSVKEAQEAEAAQRRLSIALANTGQFSEEAVASLNEYAESIQRTTTFSDDYVKALLAQSVAIGNTAEESKELVGIALNLESALGVDAATALKSLSQATEGNLGALTKLVPELKGFTAEQIKAGEATEFLAKRFAGFAESEALDYEGAVKQAGNALGELQETLGGVWTENEAVRKVVESVKEVFEFFTDELKDNKSALSNWVTGAATVAIEVLATMLETIADLNVGWANLKGTIVQMIQSTVGGQETYLKTIIESKEEAESFRVRIGQLVGKLADYHNEIDSGATKTDSFTDRLNKTSKSFVDLTSVVEDFDNGVGFAVERVDALSKKLSLIDGFRSKGLFGAGLGGETGGRLGTSLEAPKIAQPSIDKDQVKSDWQQATVEGISGALQSGTIGGLLQSTGGTIGQAIGEPMVAAISGLGGVPLDALSKSPQQSFQRFIDGLLSSLLKALTNIGPAIEVLADNVDEIVLALFEAMPTILESLLRSLPNIFRNLVRASVNIFSEMTRKMFENLFKFWDAFLDFDEIKEDLRKLAGHITGFFVNTVDDAADKFRKFAASIGDSFSQAGKWFVNGIITFMNHVIDLINLIPWVDDIDHLQKFARGGVVNGAQGDAVPVVAHAGEMILNQQQQARLMALLNGQGGGGGVNVTINEARSPGETVDALIVAMKNGIRQGRISATVLPR